MNRRNLLLAGVAAVCATRLSAETFEYSLTEAEWRAKLGKLPYQVLREEATERAGSSPLDREHRAGTFHCAGCDLAAIA